MSRRRTRAPRLAGGSRRAAPRSAPWWMFPVVAVVILGFVLLRVWPRRRPVEPPASPAEPLAVAEVFRRGIALSRDGHHLAAADCFGKVARERPGSWMARQSYASALYNGAQEVRMHLGKEEPVMRSSVERIALVRVSMIEARTADSLAATPQQRAVMAYQHGQILHAYGLVTDALVAFRNAARLDSSSTLIATGLREAERRLANGGRTE